jgi:hypothetical protein
MRVISTCAALLAATAATARGPAVPATTSPERCTHPTSDLSGTVQLRRGCRYDQGFRIKASGTTLDCDGAELRGSDGYPLTIAGDIADVTVQDCYVVGGNGVAVRAPNARDGETDDQLRARAPRNVVLRRLDIRGSENVGLYLHQHTRGVTLRESVIEDNSSAGVYLAPYGRGHRLIDNRIADNGHVTPEGRPRVGWYRREGVAVDASSEHLIEGNDIVGNAFGGVLLYKNCQEHAAENPRSLPRTEHARAVVLRGNRFADEPFGVWVAARQSRDLAQMGCGDPTPYDNPILTASVYHPSYRDFASAYTDFELPFVSVWPDFAEDAVVEGNTFERIERGGVRVEDDRARVAGNLFVGDFDYVFVGAPFRARLAGQPVQGTQIVDNSFAAAGGPAATFADRLALIPDEHTATTVARNHRACSFDGGWLRHGATTTAVTPTTCTTARRCDDGVLAPLTASECDDDDVADAGPDAVDGGADAGPGGGADVGPDSGADAGPGGGEDAGPGGGADAGVSPGTVDGGDADPDDSDDDSDDDDDDGNVDDGDGRAAGAVRDESCGAGGAGGAAPGPVTLLAWVACAGRWRRRRRA